MKITIKVESQVPYTDVLCGEELIINAEELHAAKFDLAGREIAKMESRVHQAVADEMAKRGIKLGADGLHC